LVQVTGVQTCALPISGGWTVVPCGQVDGQFSMRTGGWTVVPCGQVAGQTDKHDENFHSFANMAKKNNGILRFPYVTPPCRPLYVVGQ
jgi:hypothetical protein